jgi:DNA invertase Pin-like site-specific DNA recombinase
MTHSPTPSTPRRCAAYARVSTRHQAAEGFSLPEQRRRLTEHADAQGWSVTLYEDAGRSGETLEGRPGLMALLAAVEAGQVDVVLVVDESRLARSNLAGAIIRDRLRRAGVTLATPAGEKDLTDPSQKFTAEVLASAHALEQGMRTAKMAQGLKATVRAGFWPGGPAPFGWRLAPDPGGSTHKVLEIDEQEAATLRRAVELVVDDGLTVYRACVRLKAEGRLARNRRPWRHENIRSHLKDPSLMGRWVYKTAAGPIDLAIPAIIPPERYEALQAALKRRSRGPGRTQKVYPLTGHLRCRCGGALSGVYRRENRRRYYQCSFKGPDEGERRCPCFPKQRRADDLEQAVWDAVSLAITDPAFLIRLADEYHSVREAASGREKEQKATLQHRRETLVDQQVHVLRNRSLAPEAAQRALDDLQAELREVDRGLARLREWEDRREAKERSHDALRHLAATARERLQEPTLEMMSQVFDLLDLEIREAGEPTRNEDGTTTYPLEIRGILPIPGPEEKGLALAVGSELGEEGLPALAPRPPRCDRGAGGGRDGPECGG